MKAMVIDDSRTFRRLICSYVSDLDIETVEAEDGCEALVKLGEGDASDYGVAFVDWDMPRMSGIEFVRELRSCREFDDMKIMMVTAHNHTADLLSALNEGANEFLMKPIDREMVCDKLRIMGLVD